VLALLFLLVPAGQQVLHGLELALRSLAATELLPLVAFLEEDVEQSHERLLAAQTGLQVGEFLLGNLQQLLHQVVPSAEGQGGLR
jgi:hypothetical protein